LDVLRQKGFIGLRDDDLRGYDLLVLPIRNRDFRWWLAEAGGKDAESTSDLRAEDARVTIMHNDD